MSAAEITRADVEAGRIPDKPIDAMRGIFVPAGLQTNAMTLPTHQLYCSMMGQRPLNRSEAEMVKHRDDEIEAYFGPVMA